MRYKINNNNNFVKYQRMRWLQILLLHTCCILLGHDGGRGHDGVRGRGSGGRGHIGWNSFVKEVKWRIIIIYTSTCLSHRQSWINVGFKTNLYSGWGQRNTKSFKETNNKLQARVKAEYKGVLTTTLSSKRRKIGQFIHTGGQSGGKQRRKQSGEKHRQEAKLM